MERIFLEDIGKRFKIGDIKDFPRSTWTQIEKSVGRPLDIFSCVKDDYINRKFSEQPIIESQVNDNQEIDHDAKVERKRGRPKLTEKVES